MTAEGDKNSAETPLDPTLVWRKTRPLISVVAPCYNEIEALDLFVETLSKTLLRTGCPYEVVFVDDGSTDGGRDRLAHWAKQKKEIKAIIFSRNFGKEAAVSAGLDHAEGDVVIVMDVDLQDPPELILDFIAKWREGYDVVYGVRADRQSDSFAKRFTAGKFYQFFNKIAGVKIPENTGDFRLMDRKVVDAINKLPERSRFMKGLFAWVGYRSIGVPYARPERSAGVSKFNYWRLWNFAIDGFVSFSSAPLRVWSYVGAAVAAFSFLYASFIILRTIVTGVDVPGYASLLTFMLFLGGIQIISVGVLGEYISRLFTEAKQRPIYLVDEIYSAETFAPSQAAREEASNAAPDQNVAANNS